MSFSKAQLSTQRSNGWVIWECNIKYTFWIFQISDGGTGVCSSLKVTVWFLFIIFVWREIFIGLYLSVLTIKCYSGETMESFCLLLSISVPTEQHRTCTNKHRIHPQENTESAIRQSDMNCSEHRVWLWYGSRSGVLVSYRLILSMSKFIIWQRNIDISPSPGVQVCMCLHVPFVKSRMYCLWIICHYNVIMDS